MGFLSRPKTEKQPALPPAANPPIFASTYSAIAGGANRKKKITPKDSGFGTDGGGLDTNALAKPSPTATPSLLG